MLYKPLGHQGAGCGALVLPGGGQDTLGLVVPGQTMDSAFNQNKTELGILVLPVSLKMFPDGDSLFDEVVAVLWEFGSHTFAFQDTQNFVASDKSDLGNTMGVPKDDTNLLGSQTFLGELEDLILHLIRG